MGAPTNARRVLLIAIMLGPLACSGGGGGSDTGAQSDAVADDEPTCVPSCDGKQCGDDGCGGQCGACDGGKTCQDSQCVCQANSGKACGSDNILYWFDSCGNRGEQAENCSPGTCSNDSCVACAPDCTGKQCGDDGCGQNCGTCDGGKTCQDSHCVCG